MTAPVPVSRGGLLSLAKWIAVVWALSLLVAVVVIGGSALLIRSGANDARAAIAEHRYADAVDAAAGLDEPSNACRIALALPAPVTFRILPGTSTWMKAANSLCDIGFGLGNAASQPDVRAVAASLSGSAIHDVGITKELVTKAVAASEAAGPWVTEALEALRDLDALSLPGSVGARVHELAQDWPPTRTAETQRLIKLAPQLLGFDRPRNYFVALESSAEMRATGGFLGQYAIVRIADGKPVVVQTGPNTDLQTPSAPGVELLPGTEAITLTDNPMPVNSNLSPHGPDVGALWLNAWQQQTGVKLDGAIGLDVTTAARLAETAGAMLTRPNGDQISGAAAIADYAQNGVYFDFDSPDAAGDPRKSYQLGVLRELLHQAAKSVWSAESLAKVLPTAISEGRVLIRFSDAALQEQIATSPVSQSLAADPQQLRVTWNNWAGNKFDWYLRVQATANCAANNGYDVTLDISNKAEPGRNYPAYIGQRLDTPSELRASVRDQFLLVLPEGAALRWLTVDGGIAAYQVSLLGDRPVVQLILDSLAGQSHQVRFGWGGATATSLQVFGSQARPLACS